MLPSFMDVACKQLLHMASLRAMFYNKMHDKQVICGFGSPTCPRQSFSSTQSQGLLWTKVLVLPRSLPPFINFHYCISNHFDALSQSGSNNGLDKCCDDAVKALLSGGLDTADTATSFTPQVAAGTWHGPARSSG